MNLMIAFDVQFPFQNANLPHFQYPKWNLIATQEYQVANSYWIDQWNTTQLTHAVLMWNISCNGCIERNKQKWLTQTSTNVWSKISNIRCIVLIFASVKKYSVWSVKCLNELVFLFDSNIPSQLDSYSIMIVKMLQNYYFKLFDLKDYWGGKFNEIHDDQVQFDAIEMQFCINHML